MSSVVRASEMQVAMKDFRHICKESGGHPVSSGTQCCIIAAIIVITITITIIIISIVILSSMSSTD